MFQDSQKIKVPEKHETNATKTDQNMKVMWVKQCINQTKKRTAMQYHFQIKQRSFQKIETSNMVNHSKLESSCTSCTKQALKYLTLIIKQPRHKLRATMILNTDT